MSECTAGGCERQQQARGYCNPHYNRIIRRGGPAESPTPQQRFWSKVEKTEGCWNWTAGKNNLGYGAFGLDGKTEKAHRVSYEWANGSIPADEWLDHICRNRACVRPDHLRIVTPMQNAENKSGAPKHNKNSGIRGVTKQREGWWQARATHNGKSYSAGLHRTIEAAEAAVIALRLQLHTHNELDRQQQQGS